jgi:hypothetical protein
MLKLLTTTLLLAAWTGGAQAANTWQEFESITKVAIATKVEGIKNLKMWRDDICPRLKDERNLKACKAAYDVIILRRVAEQATMELRLIGAQMDPFARTIVINDPTGGGIAPVKELDEMNAATTRMFDRVWKAFNVEPTPPTPGAEAKRETPVEAARRALDSYVPPPVPAKAPPSLAPSPTTAMAAVKLPANGVLHARKGSTGVARLGIVTPSDSHYLIKFVSEDSKKREIVFFVRADSDFEGKVPLGKYRIVGVHGATWLGEQDYFGDESVFFKLRTKDQEEVFSFWKDKTTTHGRKFTFKKVVDGNIGTPPIDRAEFENN